MSRPREPRVTISDIARAAKVSPATVSLVLNHKGSINEQTRARVQKIARDMNFVPNSIARALRGGRTRSIGVVVNHLQNPFFTAMFNGIERVTDAGGYTVLVSQTHDDLAKEQDQVRLMAERGVDGLILLPCSQEWSHLDEAARRYGLPVLLVGNFFETREYLAVVADNWNGSRRAVEHLIGLGRRPIVHVSGPSAQTMCLFRQRGFELAMAEHFPDFSPADCIFPVRAMTPAEGYRIMPQVLERHPAPLSMFVVNDDTALGVLRFCAEHGLRIPEDLALVGFSDIETLGYLNVPLTTVRIPAEAMGHKAAAMLIASIDQGGLPAPERLVLPVELVVRGSTRLPPPPQP